MRWLWGNKCMKEQWSVRFTAPWQVPRQKWFPTRNIIIMAQVYLLFPKRDTLCLVLSWSHYRLLMGIDNEERRNFYQKECVKGMQDQAFFTISSISLHFCSISATSRSWQRVRSRLWRSRCILKYTSPSR